MFQLLVKSIFERLKKKDSIQLICEDYAAAVTYITTFKSGCFIMCDKAAGSPNTVPNCRQKSHSWVSNKDLKLPNALIKSDTSLLLILCLFVIRKPQGFPSIFINLLTLKNFNYEQFLHHWIFPHLHSAALFLSYENEMSCYYMVFAAICFAYNRLTM